MLDLSRSAAILGSESLSDLESCRVAVVGVGGVGSWCAEALIRTGIRNLALVDDDVVAPSNINRQCPAIESTMGMPKVMAMRARLLEINPSANVQAVRERYPVVSGLNFNEYDVVVDAIDSVDCKAELILSATDSTAELVSSMGAAHRFDPTKVIRCCFDKIQGDGLARALRKRFKTINRFPSRKFACVCSTEVPRPTVPGQPKGSLMPVTCAFGMTLAAEVIRICTDGRKGRGERI